jgi:hypothetical protein
VRNQHSVRVAVSCTFFYQLFMGINEPRAGKRRPATWCGLLSALFLLSTLFKHQSLELSCPQVVGVNWFLVSQHNRVYHSVWDIERGIERRQNESPIDSLIGSFCISWVALDHRYASPLFLRATGGHSTWRCNTSFVANTKNILAPLQEFRENWRLVKIESRNNDVRACMHRNTMSNSEKPAFRNWTIPGIYYYYYQLYNSESR